MRSLLNVPPGRTMRALTSRPIPITLTGKATCTISWVDPTVSVITAFKLLMFTGELGGNKPEKMVPVISRLSYAAQFGPCLAGDAAELVTTLIVNGWPASLN